MTFIYTYLWGEAVLQLFADILASREFREESHDPTTSLYMLGAWLISSMLADTGTGTLEYVLIC